MSTVWFTSDLHLGHENIFGFGQRHFTSIKDHDQHIIDNWNRVVGKRDMVWVLGDVAMTLTSLDKVAELNGLKKLILGNHDEFHIQEYARFFDSIFGAVKYKNMWLTHIPMHPQELYGRVNVSGHIHMKSKCIKDPRYINVNTDLHNLTPVNLEWVLTQRDAINWNDFKND